eukprot:6200752-Pyramimonas_sp.AAC.2
MTTTYLEYTATACELAADITAIQPSSTRDRMRACRRYNCYPAIKYTRRSEHKTLTISHTKLTPGTEALVHVSLRAFGAGGKF